MKSYHGAGTFDSTLISDSMGSSDNSIQKTDKANIELSDQCDNNKDKCDFDRLKLNKIRTKNFDRLIIGNLNINSLSSKFDQLKLLTQGKVDILIITETKLDDSFPIDQFIIIGYSKPYRLDRNRNGGGIIIIYIAVVARGGAGDTCPPPPPPPPPLFSKEKF